VAGEAAAFGRQMAAAMGAAAVAAASHGQPEQQPEQQRQDEQQREAAARQQAATLGAAAAAAATEAYWPAHWFVADDAAGGTRYVLVQGSVTMEHWRINLQIDPVPFEDEALGIKVHRGMYQAANQLWVARRVHWCTGRRPRAGPAPARARMLRDAPAAAPRSPALRPAAAAAWPQAPPRIPPNPPPQVRPAPAQREGLCGGGTQRQGLLRGTLAGRLAGDAAHGAVRAPRRAEAGAGRAGAHLWRARGVLPRRGQLRRRRRRGLQRVPAGVPDLGAQRQRAAPPGAPPPARLAWLVGSFHEGRRGPCPRPRQAPPPPAHQPTSAPCRPPARHTPPRPGAGRPAGAAGPARRHRAQHHHAPRHRAARLHVRLHHGRGLPHLPPPPPPPPPCWPAPVQLQRPPIRSAPGPGAERACGAPLLSPPRWPTSCSHGCRPSRRTTAWRRTTPTRCSTRSSGTCRWAGRWAGRRRRVQALPCAAPLRCAAIAAQRGA
jgi:hypothetical protein